MDAISGRVGEKRNPFGGAFPIDLTENDISMVVQTSMRRIFFRSTGFRTVFSPPLSRMKLELDELSGRAREHAIGDGRLIYAGLSS
ncbi:unnamed protein product [Victoria cruziana]